MLTIVHLADLHLGASYSFLPAEKAAIARESQFTSCSMPSIMRTPSSPTQS